MGFLDLGLEVFFNQFKSLLRDTHVLVGFYDHLDACFVKFGFVLADMCAPFCRVRAHNDGEVTISEDREKSNSLES